MLLPLIGGGDDVIVMHAHGIVNAFHFFVSCNKVIVIVRVMVRVIVMEVG